MAFTEYCPVRPLYLQEPGGPLLCCCKESSTYLLFCLMPAWHMVLRTIVYSEVCQSCRPDSPRAQVTIGPTIWTFLVNAWKEEWVGWGMLQPAIFYTGYWVDGAETEDGCGVGTSINVQAMLLSSTYMAGLHSSLHYILVSVSFSYSLFSAFACLL